MNKKEFSRIRSRLGKTQQQMAQLLGVSNKAIQSFEQGWRKVPVHVERQSLLLAALKGSHVCGKSPCWTLRKCPIKTRETCPAWEFKAGHLCWIINGTICHGSVQKSWAKKIELCRKCEVFKPLLA
jgi:DNA-binding XRE family transcriptional regulator